MLVPPLSLPEFPTPSPFKSSTGTFPSSLGGFTFPRLTDVIRRCQQILFLWIDGRSEHLEPDQEW